jgi:hypothetical protein
VALLLALALLIAAWPAASALAAADTYQSPEQLNLPGTPLATSYSRTDSNVGATGTTYFCNSINYTDDVWYQIHPHASGIIAAQAFSNDFFPVVTVWAVDGNGTPGNLPSGTAPCQTASSATRTAFVGGIVVEGGKTYDVQVGISASRTTTARCSRPAGRTRLG